MTAFAESDYDTMDRSFAFGSVGPSEGAVGKVDLEIATKHIFTEDTGLIALHDRVGGDECGLDIWVDIHHIC